MDKYRIHIDPPLPDRERIARYQNFDSLYGQYQSHTRFEFWRNLYRKPRNFALLAMVVALGVLVFRANEPTAAPRPYQLMPAQADLDIPRRAQTLSVSEAHDINVSPAVKVNLPAQAWQDGAGQLVQGTVELHYRTMIDPAALFVAGVPRPRNHQPMANIHLVEVYATQAGQRLYLREGYPLGITWELSDRPAQARVAQLPDQADAWVAISELVWEERASVVEPRPAQPAILDRATDTLISKGAKAPSPPSRPFGVKLTNPTDFPEFSRYEKVFWEHVPRPGTVDPWHAGLVGPTHHWEEVSVRRLPQQGLYELRFSRVSPDGGLEVKRVAARPMFEAANEAEAQAIWAERQATYRVARAQSARQDSLHTAQQREFEAARQRYSAEVAAWEARQQESSTAAGVRLRYELTQPGVSGFWESLPAATKRQVQLNSPDGSSLPLVPSLAPWCYAVQGDTLLPLQVHEKGHLDLQGDGSIKLWWVTDGVGYRFQADDAREGNQPLPPIASQALADWTGDLSAWLSWWRGEAGS
jgi:hypothetical protein